MAVTIKDVAKLAGVSISTVSRVINKSKPVSSEVKAKVLEAIDELGYKPNEVARSLVTRRSNLIGVVATDIGRSYIAQNVRGIEEVARMYNYDIILSNSYGDPRTEKKFAGLLRSKQVEGIVLISEIPNDEVIEYIGDFGIPFMYLNKYYISSGLPSVSIDHREAGYRMTNYLIELGHRNILYLTSYEGRDSSLERYKVEGYERAMDNVIGARKQVYPAQGFRVEHGYAIGDEVRKLIEEDDITAIFCCHDELALGLMGYCYDNGIRIPEDISICGYGDTKMASIYRPQLTTIREPYYDMGAVAIRRIIKYLNDGELEEGNTYLPIQLMKRQSCSSNCR